MNFKKIFKNASTISLSFLAIILALIILAFTYLYLKTPLAKSLSTRSIPQTTTIYDKTGQHVLYELHGEENRKILGHNDIPDTIRISTIAAEDDGFYNHIGVDFLSILRAIKSNIEKNGTAEGASTITQQLARNAFLSRDKTFKRKINELIIALKIERQYSKDDILDMYLNEIPYGSNAYGIGSAAKIFFGKEARDLTLDEAALISALPKATSYYSPYGNHIDELIYRQQRILDRISELDLADNEDIAEAKKINVAEKIIPFTEKIEAPHFVFYVKEELEKKFGKDAIEDGGLKVYTTLDYDLQKNAELAISENENTLQKYGASNAALVSLDPTNGNILAMVGSKDYYNKQIDGNVNITISPRQPGSSFKPFVYAAAFEKGFHPEINILDKETDFGKDGTGKNYIPKNYDGKYHGVVTMRQALATSLNVPAVKTLTLASIENTVSLVNRFGVAKLENTNDYGLSLALGGEEVRMLDEASGYAVFAAEGKKNSIKSISKIIDSKNEIFYIPEQESSQILDMQVARKINSVLSDNRARSAVFGPNSKLHIPGKTVAAKTGTTSEYKDAWTAGYTPHIVAVAWAGNNDNRSMKTGADGSYVAAPIWNSFMQKALANYSDEPFEDYVKFDPDDPNIIFDKVVYKKKNGKEISEKKAKDKDPDKIDISITYFTANSIVNE
ncbi:MAG: penicillin-binding protein, 1A family [uncultured bacterium]|nr:MAG: penicillin-binding protein, 1A family [uncultured bacterium]